MTVEISDEQAVHYAELATRAQVALVLLLAARENLKSLPDCAGLVADIDQFTGACLPTQRAGGVLP